VIPGFVDIHIHGGFGIDFMTATGSDDVQRLSRELQKVGYEGWLPTTVTAGAEDVKRVLAHLPDDDEMVLGFHLEGPFISTKYPGAQPSSYIAEPPKEGSEWDDVLNDPRLKVITVAPELPGALGLVRRLSNRGVIVSMGHTNATYEEAMAAERAGARHTTHTFNAMRPLHHREAGTVGYALASDRIATELIYDRHHVSKEAASILIKSKPKDKLIAVSDGTMASGMAVGETLKMWGLEAVIGEGQVRLKDGTLAGSAITLLDAFRNLLEDFGPETAIQACCLNPRKALGMKKPQVHLVLNRALEIVERV
jgi:N-acetylglucosamine-6-phosphate deacetylase